MNGESPETAEPAMNLVNGVSRTKDAPAASVPAPGAEPEPEQDLEAEQEAEPQDVVSEEGEDGAVPDGAEPPVEPHELRPQRKLRLWQLAPIVVLGALGSLMFAFPLAFEPGGSSGAVVSMLGLLLCGCAAGWGVMAARRVGQTWPGLPARGSGKRPDWRVVLIYAVVVCTVVVLAVWRVARLRG
ncbi:hypothetical protein OIE63_10705 [Streptomyces sp. NBC_01795]|nr:MULTISPECIES: hypothetical protein [unclassified Streptomyces]WSA91985.1 hypothetical protein OIE63_10705 [Streptomyces sp. NBC_01795]WSB76352.1 hypothetical protein OHB04_11500 [Streptomyces sp. NBC_01775]WSS15373.1 hypothetical protein OG533_28415 [Streptomyces sp. NBC_01186]WSS44218.1 hypothetical protein OG220_29225 [Streptomyces sp. NBC_01187]